MSTSTNAYLFYGITEADNEEWGQEIDEETDEYSWYKPETEDALKALGVTVGSHCSGDYPMWFIATVKITARRGYPQAIAPDTLTTQPDWNDKIIAAGKVLNIPVNPAKIGWYLASYWG